MEMRRKPFQTKISRLSRKFHLDAQRVINDQYLAVALGAPRIAPAEQMESVRQWMLAAGLPDPQKMAELRAGRIRSGLEPRPELFGYRWTPEIGVAEPPVKDSDANSTGGFHERPQQT